MRAGESGGEARAPGRRGALPWGAPCPQVMPPPPGPGVWPFGKSVFADWTECRLGVGWPRCPASLAGKCWRLQHTEQMKDGPVTVGAETGGRPLQAEGQLEPPKPEEKRQVPPGASGRNQPVRAPDVELCSLTCGRRESCYFKRLGLWRLSSSWTPPGRTGRVSVCTCGPSRSPRSLGTGGKLRISHLEDVKKSL